MAYKETKVAGFNICTRCMVVFNANMEACSVWCEQYSAKQYHLGGSVRTCVCEHCGTVSYIGPSGGRVARSTRQLHLHPRIVHLKVNYVKF